MSRVDADRCRVAQSLHCCEKRICSSRRTVYVPTYISSSGEMKMSLKLMTCSQSILNMPADPQELASYVLVPKMLQ